MIDYMKFDVMLFDDVIASVDLKPNGSDKPYVINYIEGFNKQFSPNPEGYITKDELEKWLKWHAFPETRVNADELLAALGLNSYNRWAIVCMKCRYCVELLTTYRSCELIEVGDSCEHQGIP